jgi:hypothetical protein
MVLFDLLRSIVVLLLVAGSIYFLITGFAFDNQKKIIRGIRLFVIALGVYLGLLALSYLLS